MPNTADSLPTGGGLGKNELGMKDAIQVTNKQDTCGVSLFIHRWRTSSKLDVLHVV